MIFNNAPLRFYSSVEIIEPPLNANGTYDIQPNGRYGPELASTTYTATPQSALFSRNMSSAQMLPNGNLFISSAVQGITTEVTPSNEVVWKYKSPVTVNGIVGRTDPTTNPNFASRPIFRVIKYPADYPAFVGRVLTAGEPVEGAPFAPCDLVTAVEEKTQAGISYPNPADDQMIVTSPGCFTAVLSDGQGKRVFEGVGNEKLQISTSQMAAGLYVLRVGNRVEKVVIKH